MLTCLYQVSAGETGKQWERLVKFYSLFLCVCPSLQYPHSREEDSELHSFFVFDSTVKRKHMLEMMAMVVLFPLKCRERVKLLRIERFNTL